MTRWRSIGGLLMLATAVHVAPLSSEDKKPEDKDRDHVAKLIRQLGDDDADVRDDAEEELGKLGPKAIEALRTASSHSDAEIRRRARKLVAVIERKMAVEAILAPKKVRLKFDDVHVAAAVEQLAKQSGYRIQLSAEATAKNRKVTLSTEEVTFNEALDLLCRKAGLVQSRISAKTKGGGGSFEKGGKGIFGTNVQEPETISLRDGPSPEGPTIYAGSVCLRALALTKEKDDQFAVTLEAVAEPRLIDFRVKDVKIDKAVDDQGQTLEVVSVLAKLAKESSKKKGGMGKDSGFPSRPSTQERISTLSLKKGEKTGKSLRELSGQLTVSVLYESGPVATIDDVLKSTGKSASGKAGYSMKLTSVMALDNDTGDVRVNASVTTPQTEEKKKALEGGDERFGGPRASRTSSPTFRLFDEKGREWELVSVTYPKKSMTKENNRDTTYSLLFRPPEQGAKAAKLRMYPTAPTEVVVPFTLKDVPLK